MAEDRLIVDTVDPSLQEALKIQQQGDFASAEKIYADYLAKNPENIPAQHFLGLVHYQQGLRPQGLAEMQRAIQVKSNFIQAYLNLGQAYLMEDQAKQALECYMEAVLIDTHNVKALQGYGESHRRLGNTVEYTKAMGHISFFQGDYASALSNYHYCLKHSKFLDRNTEFNVAVCLKVMGRWEESHALVQKLLQDAPEDIELNYLDSDLLMGMGYYELGWQKYETRFEHMGNEINCRKFSEPEWDGAPLQGRTLLLHKEQGNGDMLQFIRYVPMMAKTGGKIIVEAAPEMVPLFKLLPEIDELVEYKKVPFPAHDVQLSIMSLPRVFKTTLETIPDKVPYFHLPKHIVPRLETSKKLKVAIAWTGSALHNYNHLRSIQYEQFKMLFSVPDVQFYNLQFEAGEVTLAALAQAGVIDLTAKCENFLQSAAYVAQMDLVIAVDTALVHLAGALNKPVWTLLSVCVDWRWGRTADTTPWYPSMRLWRQRELSDWEELLQRVRKALAALSLSS